MNTPVGRDAYRELAKMTKNEKLRRTYVRLMRRQWRIDYGNEKRAAATAQF